MSDKHQNSILRPTRRQALTMMGLVRASGLVMPGIFGRDKAYAAPPSAPKGQVIIGFSQEPTVFNPHMLHIEVDEGIHFSVFDPLFNVDPEGKFTPHLQPKCRVSKTAVFRLMASIGKSSCAMA